jgi:hypothetical protein
VPAASAPAEIVANERLCFRDNDHAVEVIDRLLRDEAQLASIRQKLAARAELFSRDRFAAEARELVESTLRTAQNGSALEGDRCGTEAAARSVANPRA